MERDDLIKLYAGYAMNHISSANFEAYTPSQIENLDKAFFFVKEIRELVSKDE